jgi:glutamine synthetase
MSEPGDELVAFLYADLAGLCRGRAVPQRRLAGAMAAGVGWVPADQAITPLGPLAEPNPWGSVGDLRLVPDATTETRVDLWPDVPPLHFMLCDARTPAGEPWDACPRALLRRALARLEDEHGLRLRAAFEQEFVLAGHTAAPPPAFSHEALRLAEPLGLELSAALRLAGIELENFLPEYGDDQFEITVAPRHALAAADAAAIVRELVREVARRHGWRATFAPILAPDGTGSGTHVHLSFAGAAMHDPERPGGLSVTGGRFAAGVLAHLPAICAAAAPAPVSYHRLQPHRWSAGGAVLATGNREAALRIPSPVTFAGRDPAEQARLELRVGDGACSPHFLLALVVLAGMEGLRDELEPAPVVREFEPDGVLPTSLAAALDAFVADPLVQAEVPAELRDGYLAMKRLEIELVEGLTDAEACARYARAY